MKPEKARHVKQLLRELRDEREFIWKVISERTKFIREAGRDEENNFLIRMADKIDRYNALANLYRSLIEKRSPTPEEPAANGETRHKPLDREPQSLTERLEGGLRHHIFKLN